MKDKIKDNIVEIVYVLFLFVFVGIVGAYISDSIYNKTTKSTVVEVDYTEYAKGETSYLDNSENDEDKPARVNINTADKEELDELDGIGEEIAQRILDYRENVGEFKNIEQIKNVSGIGDKKYEQIKDFIVVE